MSAMASEITSLTIVYSIVHSGRGERKHQSSTSLAIARGIHRRPVNSPHKGPEMQKIFPLDDVIMGYTGISLQAAAVQGWYRGAKCEYILLFAYVKLQEVMICWLLKCF